MADTKREIERKYEATPDTPMPDLTKVPGVADVVGKGVAELDAVYYDTADLRLAAASVTLRRRTGGADAGWHLKLPVSPGVRDEITAPLSDGIPAGLAALVRVHARGEELVPVVRLLSSRDVHHLVDADGALLAELSRDAVVAERLHGGNGTAQWDEIEVELADGGDPAFLDAVDKRLRKAEVRAAAASSKLARALTETGTGPARPSPEPSAARTAGDQVLAYVREQAAAIVAYDPGVRRDLPDAVHRMRVATRRLRSTLRTHRKVLDRHATQPVIDELKWLAAELGVARDQEVLAERLHSRVDAVPVTLLLGPVAARLRQWSVAGAAEARRTAVAALDGDRYLALLDALDGLLADPPLLKAAEHAPEDVLAKAVLKEYDRLAARMAHALSLPAGEERDLAMHDARKAAKRARYAAEVARPALGKPAKRFGKRMKAVQQVLGDHQDSVVARQALRDLAVQAHAAGESAFVWGLLYGREEARAGTRETELPRVWAEASAPGIRAALGG
ncbi:CYTH and CHAD domain-containing protein [Streptomyces sp. NPDC048389]|uniref:CYTH and CHAD domain-containing protein n=1 Tax=Streptomyces sp. NPDC048389 TaxID=3154622 RepID=UPI00345215F8